MVRKVLIVDDDRMNRQKLRAMLQTDYTILEAGSGKAALELLRQDPEGISAVLLDILMPEMDGCEVLRLCREDVLLSQLPVIVVTDLEDESSRVKALSLGASDFVTKPCHPDIVAHTLRNNIALRETASIVNAIQKEKPDGLYTRELEKERRATVEQLLILSDVAHDLLAQTDTRTGVDGTLRKLMEYFDGVRAYIFEIDREKSIAVNTYEVCADGVTEEKDNLQTVPLHLLDYWHRAFEHRNYIAIMDVNELDESRAEERDILLMQGVSSLFAVPLCRDGKVFGILGVDDPKRQMTQLDRLLALGDYIAVMLTRRDYEARLAENARTLTQMIQDMPGGYIKMRITRTGVVAEFVNDELCRMCGMTHEQAVALYAADAYAGVHPDDLYLASSVLNKAIAARTTVSLRLRFANGCGGYTPIQAFYRVTEDSDGLHLSGYYTDATEMDRAERQRRDLLENLPCGAGIYEIAGNVTHATYLNKLYRAFLKREIGEMRDVSVFELVHPDDVEKLKEEIQTALTGNKDGVCDVRIMDGSGGYLPFHLTGRVMELGKDKTAIYVTYIPITEKEMQMQRRAETDGMTGVYNKLTAETLIRKRLDGEGGVPCAMMIADIDGLKTIHDSMGHPQGDRAICFIADALKSLFGKTDIVGRMGGDEFVVFLKDVEGRDELESMALKLQRSLSGARIGAADDYPVRMSVGIVETRTGEAAFDELYSRADRALYEAKRNGKNQYAFYAEDM